MSERSRTAALAAGIGVAALSVAALGPLLVLIGIIAPIMGFFSFALAALLGLLALLLGLVGLWRTNKASGRSGRERAFVGIGSGGVLVLVLLVGASSGGSAPPIHDLSTDIENPPTFSDSVRNAAGRDNGVDYPDGGPDVPGLQRSAYPELVSAQLSDTPIAALERSRAAAESLGWEISSYDAAALRIEATETTSVFRFVDDIVIRVQPSATGSIVDVRSNSRVGLSDLGANAARIMAFLALINS